MGFLGDWEKWTDDLYNKKKQQSVDLQTTSNFDVGTSLASRLSYLSGGGTKKQVSADTGASVGMTAGGLLGAHFGRKYLRKAIDEVVEHPKLLKDTANTYLRSASGKTLPTKIIAGRGASSYYKFLRDMPKSLRGNILKTVGLTAGGMFGGYAAGGILGHSLTGDVNGLPVRVDRD